MYHGRGDKQRGYQSYDFHIVQLTGGDIRQVDFLKPTNECVFDIELLAIVDPFYTVCLHPLLRETT